MKRLMYCSMALAGLCAMAGSLQAMDIPRRSRPGTDQKRATEEATTGSSVKSGTATRGAEDAGWVPPWLSAAEKCGLEKWPATGAGGGRQDGLARRTVAPRSDEEAGDLSIQ